MNKSNNDLIFGLIRAIEKDLPWVLQSEQNQEGQQPPKIITALSGGADSVFLLFLLRQWLASRSLEPGSILLAAHARHGLRRDDSKDLQFCQTLCADWQIPFISQDIHVPRNKSKHESDEMAARRLRYQFLNQVRADNKAGPIALGHHLNDQIETIMMRMGQGTGPDGFIAMQVNDPPLWRPLLFTAKKDIVAALQQRQIAWIEDASNTDPRHLRNKIRPLAEQWLNAMPKLGPSMGVLQDILIRQKKMIADWHEQWLEKKQLCPRPHWQNCFLIPVADLASEPPARQQELLFFLWNKTLKINDHILANQKNMKHLWQQWQNWTQRLGELTEKTSHHDQCKNPANETGNCFCNQGLAVVRHHTLWQNKKTCIKLMQMTCAQQQKSWFLWFGSQIQWQNSFAKTHTNFSLAGNKGLWQWRLENRFAGIDSSPDLSEADKIEADHKKTFLYTLTTSDSHWSNDNQQLNIDKYEAFTLENTPYQVRNIEFNFIETPADFDPARMNIEIYACLKNKEKEYSFHIDMYDAAQRIKADDAAPSPGKILQPASIHKIIKQNLSRELRPWTPLLIYEKTILAILFQALNENKPPRLNAQARALGFEFEKDWFFP